MNRTIKLRAWDKNQNIMMSMQDLLIGDGLYLIFSEKRAISGLIPMEFTGLTDKNGKEIWENDIVITAGYRSVVKYEAPHFTCRYDLGNAEEMDFDVFEDIEVIGNVFENDNLLKENK